MPPLRVLADANVLVNDVVSFVFMIWSVLVLLICDGHRKSKPSPP